MEPVSLSHSVLFLNNSRNKFITDKSRNHQLGPWGNVLEKGSHPLKEARPLDSITLFNVRAVFHISSWKASFLFVSRNRFSECPNMILETNPGGLEAVWLEAFWDHRCEILCVIHHLKTKRTWSFLPQGFCVMQALCRFQSRNHFPLTGPLCVCAAVGTLGEASLCNACVTC